MNGGRYNKAGQLEVPTGMDDETHAEIEHPAVLAACVTKVPGHDGDLNVIARKAWDLYLLVLSEPERRREERQYVEREAHDRAARAKRYESYEAQGREVIRELPVPKSWNEHDCLLAGALLVAHKIGCPEKLFIEALEAHRGVSFERARQLIMKMNRKLGMMASKHEIDPYAVAKSVTLNLPSGTFSGPASDA